MLIRPLAADIGIIAPMILALGTLGLQRFNRWLSLRFEHRADSSAIEAPESSAIYAGALLKLHEFNLTPATLEKRTSTHPDLYDRMIAAGIGPEFPRPLPAARIGWTGLVFAMALGFLPVSALAGGRQPLKRTSHCADTRSGRSPAGFGPLAYDFHGCYPPGGDPNRLVPGHFGRVSCPARPR
jgi:hypothetical protein